MTKVIKATNFVFRSDSGMKISFYVEAEFCTERCVEGNIVIEKLSPGSGEIRKVYKKGGAIDFSFLSGLKRDILNEILEKGVSLGIQPIEEKSNE